MSPGNESSGGSVGLIHATAEIDDGVLIEPSASVWGMAQIRRGARVGAECVVGRGAYVGVGVVVGDRCKIQNYALVYEPARLGVGVFIGPGAILTNDQHPRAIRPDRALKGASDWDPVGVDIADGASIGAGAICVAPVHIGTWAMVAAGAVVTRNVPAFALVTGAPARQVGWVGPAGLRLVPGKEPSSWQCPESGQVFDERDGELSLRGSAP